MRFFRNDTGNPDVYYEPNSLAVRRKRRSTRNRRCAFPETSTATVTATAMTTTRSLETSFD